MDSFFQDQLKVRDLFLRLTQAFTLIYVLNITSHFTPKEPFVNFYLIKLSTS